MFISKSLSQSLCKLPITFTMFQNALLVYMCEVLVDAIKHSFLAKFNEIKPIAYSEFLEDLCEQVNLVGIWLLFFTF